MNRWREKGVNPLDLMEARDGDHIMTPFECDKCIYRKLKGRDPIPLSNQDSLLMLMIRRMNLDAFWSRARGTVKQNLWCVKQTLEMSDALGLDGPYEHSGPYPMKDHCGYEVAATMLMKSRRPGNRNRSYTQLATIKKLRSTYSSHVRASPSSNVNHLSLADNKGKYQRLSKDKCGSLWFNRFMTGMSIRMGSTSKPNQAMTTKLMLMLVNNIENKVNEYETTERNKWIIFMSYAVISYTLSLRGNEGILMNIEGLIKEFDIQRKEHFNITLLGKLKGENNMSEHIVPCINVTKSGINVKYVIERAMNVKKDEGHQEGPLISDSKGYLLSSVDLDDMLHEVLTELFEEDKSVFPPSIKNIEEVVTEFRCNRTFRRTSATRALEEEVKGTDIDIVNRWEQKGNSKKKPNSQPMK